MARSLPDLTAALIEKARQAGADAADAIAIDGTSLSLDVRGGALEHAERSEGIEIGLRVLLGRRQACVSASDTSPETLATMAERAIATAREAPEMLGGIVESYEHEGPFGAKEVGEGAIMPTIPAILNAVYDATGVRLHELPLTAERVYSAMQEVRKKRG